MSIPKGIPEDHLMKPKPTCGHQPPPGYRELDGEELIAHLKALEQFGCMSRTYRRNEYLTKEKGHCVHLYVKIEEDEAK